VRAQYRSQPQRMPNPTLLLNRARVEGAGPTRNGCAMLVAAKSRVASDIHQCGPRERGVRSS
jgi:hypothetical protein